MTRRRLVLAALGVVIAAWILGGEWVSIHAHVPENHLIDALGGLAFLAAGLIALDRRPEYSIGTLMIAFAVVSYFGNWGNLQVAMVPLVGLAGQQFGAAILAQTALTYPTGRLRTRFDRVVIGVIYGVGAATCAVIVLAFDPRADGCTRCAWEPAPFPSRPAVLTALLVSQRAGAVLVSLFLAAVWLRWRRSTPAERRALTPLWAGICIIGVPDGCVRVAGHHRRSVRLPDLGTAERPADDPARGLRLGAAVRTARPQRRRRPGRRV